MLGIRAIQITNAYIINCALCIIFGQHFIEIEVKIMIKLENFS